MHIVQSKNTCKYTINIYTFVNMAVLNVKKFLQKYVNHKNKPIIVLIMSFKCGIGIVRI